jgi:hypothetical protein
MKNRISAPIIVQDPIKTLGGLADRQGDRFSDDYKEHIKSQIYAGQNSNVLTPEQVEINKDRTKKKGTDPYAKARKAAAEKAEQTYRQKSRQSGKAFTGESGGEDRTSHRKKGGKKGR